MQLQGMLKKNHKQRKEEWKRWKWECWKVWWGTTTCPSNPSSAAGLGMSMEKKPVVLVLVVNLPHPSIRPDPFLNSLLSPIPSSLAVQGLVFFLLCSSQFLMIWIVYLVLCNMAGIIRWGLASILGRDAIAIFIEIFYSWGVCKLLIHDHILFFYNIIWV